MVSPNESGKAIKLIDVDSMTQIKCSNSFKANETNLRAAESVQGIRRKEITVIGRMHYEIMVDSPIEYIELFSFDVEGYELEVLFGITNESHFPRRILIEKSDIKGVLKLLRGRYQKVEKLSGRDYLLGLLSDY